MKLYSRILNVSIYIEIILIPCIVTEILTKTRFSVMAALICISIQHKQLGVIFIEVVSSDSLTLKTWWKISKLWPEIRVLFTEIVSDSLTLKT